MMVYKVGGGGKNHCIDVILGVNPLATWFDQCWGALY